MYKNSCDPGIFGGEAQDIGNARIPVFFDQPVFAFVGEGDGGDVVPLPGGQWSFGGTVILGIPDIGVESGLVAFVSTDQRAAAGLGHVADLQAAEVVFFNAVGEVFEKFHQVGATVVPVAPGAHELEAFAAQWHLLCAADTAVAVAADAFGWLVGGGFYLSPGVLGVGAGCHEQGGDCGEGPLA